MFTRPVHPGSRRPSPRAAFAGKPAPPLPTAARPTQTRGRSLLIFPSPSPPRPQPPRRPGFPGPTPTWPKAARALPAPPPCPPTAFISSILLFRCAHDRRTCPIFPLPIVRIQKLICAFCLLCKFETLLVMRDWHFACCAKLTFCLLCKPRQFASCA